LRDQPASALPAAAGAAIPRTRADVLRTLHRAREWLETHEPSSPVAVLLKQAERMIGKRFSQVADCIPLDLLHKWDAEDGQDATAPSGGAA
jgi:type VI secretion system protein ImpA